METWFLITSRFRTGLIRLIAWTGSIRITTWFRIPGYDGTWAGTNAKGKPLPDGTYFYILTVDPQNSNTAIHCGPLTIHR